MPAYSEEPLPQETAAPSSEAPVAPPAAPPAEDDDYGHNNAFSSVGAFGDTYGSGGGFTDVT